MAWLGCPWHCRGIALAVHGIVVAWLDSSWHEKMHKLLWGVMPMSLIYVDGFDACLCEGKHVQYAFNVFVKHSIITLHLSCAFLVIKIICFPSPSDCCTFQLCMSQNMCPI
jgi:hypothetical protein